MPHMFFWGPSGTGKTSAILALVRGWWGASGLMSKRVLHMNASHERGIEAIRERVVRFAESGCCNSLPSFKVVILDEADALTPIAQGALRGILEQYAQSTRFCFLANYSHSLSPALKSRCVSLRFGPLSETAVVEALTAVVHSEALVASSEELHAIAVEARGDLRSALSNLQALQIIPLSHSHVPRTTLIQLSTGEPSNLNLLRDLLMSDGYSASSLLRQWVEVLAELATEETLTALSGQPVTNQRFSKALQQAAQAEYAMRHGGDGFLQLFAVLACLAQT